MLNENGQDDTGLLITLLVSHIGTCITYQAIITYIMYVMYICASYVSAYSFLLT